MQCIGTESGHIALPDATGGDMRLRAVAKADQPRGGIDYCRRPIAGIFEALHYRSHIGAGVELGAGPLCEPLPGAAVSICKCHTTAEGAHQAHYRLPFGRTASRHYQPD